jgi:hypothetical protein
MIPPPRRRRATPRRTDAHDPSHGRRPVTVALIMVAIAALSTVAALVIAILLVVETRRVLDLVADLGKQSLLDRHQGETE